MAENFTPTPITTLTSNPTSAQTSINSNFTAIATVLLDVLSRSGVSPNQMASTLDMNSFQVINLPNPATANSPLRLKDLNSFIGGGTITNIPAGGSTTDVLSKNSNADYDIGWAHSNTLVTGGTNITVTGTPAVVATVANPVFSTSVTTPILVNSGNLTLPTGPDNIVSRNSTDTLLNKTIDTAGPNTLKIAGTSLTATSGSGNTLALTTSPVFTTPTLGVATATTINKITLTQPATGSTLTISDGKTLSSTNTLAFSGTDSSTLNVGVGGTLTGSSSAAVFYDNIPQNSQSVAYGLVLSDAQKHILHPAADNNARTFTIPANASVAYPIGTVITFINMINTLTIAITSDTLTQMGTGSTGSRTLAANGIATALKIASTSWVISGTGLT